MAGGAVTLVLTADDAASRAAGSALFPGATLESLSRRDLRPPVPFEGPLFALLGARASRETVGLVVPAVWTGDTGESPASGGLVCISDHLGLEGRGPLTGRWPAGVPRDFPSMTGIYQPADVRSRRGARVYSSGIVAAGVADVRRLSRFEARAVREGGCSIVSDSLVPAAIVAAYYGLRLAACGLVQAPRSYRE
jgi:hypothetical protein